MALLTVGDQFPEFNLTALKGGNLREANAASPDDYFEQVTNNSYEGKWKIVFFYPKDFTFVCPTEIAAFGKLNEEFEDRDTIVLGGSGDNEFSHFNWRATNEELLEVPFPMFADVRHDLMRALGVENADGVADRATFIIDPDGVSSSSPSPRTPSAATSTRSCASSTPCSRRRSAPATGRRTTRPRTSTRWTS